MSMIVRDSATGKVKMASISTMQKDGRILLFPQMIDITDVDDADKIVELIMEFEENFQPEEENDEQRKLRQAAENAWYESWKSRQRLEKKKVGMFGMFKRLKAGPGGR